MKITNGDRILEVSRKAYEVIYINHGYTEYVEEEKKPVKKATTKKKAGEQ